MVSTLVLLIHNIDNAFAFKFCCQLFSLYYSIYLFLLISAKEKNGQKQVKKKAFKINAKIEDVGLNED